MKSSGSTMPAGRRQRTSASAPMQRSSSSDTGRKVLSRNSSLRSRPSERLQIDHLLQCVTAAAKGSVGSRGGGRARRTLRLDVLPAPVHPVPLLGMAHHEPLERLVVGARFPGGSASVVFSCSIGAIGASKRNTWRPSGSPPARPRQHRAPVDRAMIAILKVHAGWLGNSTAIPSAARRLAGDDGVAGQCRRSTSSEVAFEKTPKPASLKRRVTRRSSQSGLIGRRARSGSARAVRGRGRCRRSSRPPSCRSGRSG